ncbi:peptidylprolyl isomerase [Candidatus Pelagibacter bacterium]|nr:peptidylprolyl isomerase [Candidatus Pelagibacter bacterium]MDC0447817.1 peptidylprolyl isomerase [Pelagibacteraceae bacterium]
MKNKISIIFFFLIFFLNGILNAKIENKIIVKVGNEVITSFEIKNKILRTLILNNSNINQENIDKLKEQVLDNLINIKLKENELKKTNVEIDTNRINEYLSKISSNDIAKLKNLFIQNNVSFELFIDELKTEFRWQKFIYQKYSKKIEVNENSLNDEIETLLKDQLEVKEVNLSEIQLLNNQNINNKKFIQNIFDEIKQNGFENTALKFSVSSSSSEKGSLGWINIKTLSKSIYDLVSNMSPGDISEPIIQSNNILLIKLNRERKVSRTDLDKDEMKKRLIKQKENELFNLYSISHLSIIKNKYFVEYK